MQRRALPRQLWALAPQIRDEAKSEEEADG
jgi:hypothetical protein